MPRVVTIPTALALPGCTISGRRLLPGGTPDCTPLEVTPGRAGVYQGVTYGKEPIIIQPAPDGRFEMTLPPSAVMGVYKVQVGAVTWNMVVPDAPNASFDSIARL
jgi:hypothetical protein